MAQVKFNIVSLHFYLRMLCVAIQLRDENKYPDWGKEGFKK